MSSENTRRIAKNTAMLYIRMLLIMAVTLYTSRVILRTLGVEDYGIYNVVGGVVAMLGFLNGSLSGASSRFITFCLGKGDKEELKATFATVLTIHLILAGVIVLLGETAGLWFVCHKLVIPPERMTAALWVYQCSIFTTVVTILSIPYNALIIAHERMGAFAYISIIEVLLRLVIVFLLVYIPYDKLIVYALLYLTVEIIIRFIYSYYCSVRFIESKTGLVWNGRLVREIGVYAGWTLNGYVAVVGYTQGINILLNMFFGPVVNAARGIAVQVQTAVLTFVQNFLTAIKPQIIKSYALSDLPYMHMLVIASSKYGFFLILLLTFPILMNVHAVLKIWLGIVPEYTVSFIQIMLLTGLISPLSGSLMNAIHATGNIKKFQIYEGTSLLMVVPLAYVLLKIYHISPSGVMLVYFFVELFTQCLRVWIVLPKISMSYSVYFTKVIFPILWLIPFLTFPVVFFPVYEELAFVQLVGYTGGAILYVFVCILVFGLNISERRMIYHFIKKKITNLSFRR